MIETRSTRIPWAWVFWMSLPVGVFAFVEKCSGTALVFTMRKFIADPALISLLASVNIAFNVLVAPLVAWKGDRMNSGHGRRKPFIVAGCLMLAAALFLLPLASSLWMLVPVILLYQFAVDFGFTGPWSPLYYEIVPSPQRGRAVALNRLMSVTARLSFNFVLIGQFDEVNAMKLNGGLGGLTSLSLTGEQLIYWTAALLVLMTGLFVMFFVRETGAAGAPVGNDRKMSNAATTVLKTSQGHTAGSLWPGRAFFTSIFGSSRSRLLCLLVVASVTAQVGIGQLQPLLITEQFGYTKRALGGMHGVIMLVEIGLVLPVMAWLLDRVNRFRLFQVGLWLATLQPLAYWAYVKYAAPGQVPPVSMIIAFTTAGALARTITLLALEPMLFDLVPPTLLGTFNAGFVMVRGVATVLLMNGTGLWVRTWSGLFCAPLKHDYMSGYLYVFACGLAGCLLVHFVMLRRRELVRELSGFAARPGTFRSDSFSSGRPCMAAGISNPA
jgi:Na+/melibiose symporter-like transporter